LERRLTGAAQAKENASAALTAAPVATPSETVEPEAVSMDSAPTVPESGGATTPTPVSPEESGWPDAAAESAFLAEARSRGELPAPKPAPSEEVEEAEAGPLPPMEKMMERIPPPVREMLDDLFRARFVRVARIPRRALKS
jgi:hypothetical protein